MLIVGFSWDRFVWDIPELLRLLKERPVEFNYLYVVRLLRARAAYLAGGGPFTSCSAIDVREGIAAGRVEFVSIYIRLFILYLEEAIARGYGTGDGEIFRLALIEVESSYVKILEACCHDPESDDEFCGCDVKSWATGTQLLRSGKRVNAMPEAVDVPVRVETTRGKRRVRPDKRECVKKLRRGEACYWFEERIGRTIPTDLALERLCNQPVTEGCKTVRYGDMCFGYFETQTNDEKTTLYVLCADRMLKIETANGVRPGSHPTEIEQVFFESVHESMYLVHFDDGEFGLFRLSFRAHTYVDRERLREALRRQKTAKETPTSVETGRTQLLLPVASQSGTNLGGSTLPGGNGASLFDHPGVGTVGDLPEESTEADDGEPEQDTGNVAPSVKIIGSYDVIRIGDEEVVFGRKYKRRGFVRFLHERKQRTGEDSFYFEEMKEEYERVTGKAIRSDRFEEDFFRGQSREFHLLFEEVDKASGRYRLKV